MYNANRHKNNSEEVIMAKGKGEDCYWLRHGGVIASLVTSCTKLGLLFTQLQPKTPKQAMGIKRLRRLVKLTWSCCHMQFERCCLDSNWEYSRVVALTTIRVSVGLTISLPCLTNNSAKSEVIEAFFPFAWAHYRKDFYPKAQYPKPICYKTIKYTVCRRVCEHFPAGKFYRLRQGRG